GDRAGSAALYFSEQPIGLSVNLRRRPHNMYQTYLQGSFRAESLGGKEESTGVARSNLAQYVGRNHGRRDAQFGFRESELRAFGSHHDVAYGSKPHTAPKRRPVDAPDNWNGTPVDSIEHAGHTQRVG